MSLGRVSKALAILGCAIVGLSPIALFGQHSTVPVVLVNGYEICKFKTDTTSVSTFGSLQSFLEADSGLKNVLFFDNCRWPNDSIDQLAAQYGQFLQGLRYADGSNVSQVDVIAHSMGGLIVRAYLAGLNGSTLSPPVDPKIRKFVLIGTPNFGGSFPDTGEVQVRQMQFGSGFTWNLATWNQGFDDLRGIDAIAIAGNAVSGQAPSDGLVTVNSASISFAAGYGDERTRVIPYCHTADVPCNGTAIANVTSRSHDSYRIMRAFLDNDESWKLIGVQPSQASSSAGVLFSVRDAGDTNYYQPPQLNSALLARNGALVSALQTTNGPILYTQATPAASNYALGFDIGTQAFNVQPVGLPAGSFAVLLAKFGPQVRAVIPSAGKGSGPLSVAADSLISLYGNMLANSTAEASTLPWPTQLSDVTLTIGGQNARLQYVSAQQVNALISSGLSPGLYQLTLTNTQGKHSINLMIEQTAPALFSLANNAAAAEHASTGQVVTSSNAATVGEYVSVFATGLGPTFSSNGLNIAVTAPTAYIGGHLANVTFAGRAPGFQGLDQINVQVPAGVQPGTSVPVVLISRNRVSNTVLLAVH